jgi:hypothetical protein
MFDALTITELGELSDRICDARDLVNRHFSLLPGYRGILADLEDAEDTLAHFSLVA